MPSARCPASISMLPRLRCAWTERSSIASAARNSAIAPADVAPVGERDAEVVVRLDGIRVGCSERAEALHRIAGLALLEQRVGEVVAGAGEVGLELERLLVAGDRFVEAAGGAQRRAEVVVAGRVVGPAARSRARGARSPGRSCPVPSSAVPRLFSVIAMHQRRRQHRPVRRRWRPRSTSAASCQSARTLSENALERALLRVERSSRRAQPQTASGTAPADTGSARTRRTSPRWRRRRAPARRRSTAGGDPATSRSCRATASGTSSPKWPTQPSTRSGVENSA